MRSIIAVASLAVAAMSMAACSSGNSPKAKPADPSTSASSSSSSSSPTPSPTPSTSAPLSPFEADPAVVALRAWASQSAKDFNAGQTFTDPALTALETAAFVPITAETYASDAAAGLHYPGPLPLSPQSVTVVSPTEHDVNACVVGTGFAVDPKTGAASGALTVVPSIFKLVLVDGAWKLNAIPPTAPFSCATVRVPEQTW